MPHGFSFSSAKHRKGAKSLLSNIYMLCLGLNSSGNSDMKVMWMKIPADNDWKQKIFPFRVGYNWEFFFCLVSKGRIFSEKYCYYFHCPKNLLCSILSFVFWIFLPLDTAVQLESADSKQNAISKYLFQDSFRHIFCQHRGVCNHLSMHHMSLLKRGKIHQNTVVFIKRSDILRKILVSFPLPKKCALFYSMLCFLNFPTIWNSNSVRISIL